MFTYHYQQPSEYHFSLDSIHFAEFLAQHLKSRTDLRSLQVLDLCAGCGVIGMELAWYLREIRSIDFVEVQAVYTPFFEKNVALVNRPELQLTWHLVNYDALLDTAWSHRYDLIISNPPYFQVNQGMLSPSEFKNRCRFFIDSSFVNYVSAIANALRCGGEAYFLLRCLKQHGSDVFAEVQAMLDKNHFIVKKLIQIRGTDVVYLKKLPIGDTGSGVAINSLSSSTD